MFKLIIFFVISIYGVNSLTVDVTDKVHFTISIDDNPIGNLTIGLFGKVAPKTVENFISFARKDGYNGLSYKGSTFHRIIKNFMIQGGDITDGDGRGSISIFGKYFDDENFILKHSESGLISMANAGPDTNGSQFFITTIITDWLDGKHTVFGKIIDGMNIVNTIEQLPTEEGNKPIANVVITDTSVSKADETIQLDQ